jgi:hypothetical protein
VDPNGQPELERQPTVPGDVVGVGVRLENRDDPNITSLGLGEQRLDRQRRVDDDCEAGIFVANEVGRTAEIVIDELREDHGTERSSRSRYRT